MRESQQRAEKDVRRSPRTEPEPGLKTQRSVVQSSNRSDTCNRQNQIASLIYDLRRTICGAGSNGSALLSMEKKLETISGLLFVLGACIAQAAAASTPWSYDGAEGSLPPQRWKEAYPACGGANQSPVWVRKRTALPLRRSLKFGGYLNNASLVLTQAPLKNTGHTAELQLAERTYVLRGGGLNGSYYATSLHFHWGKNNKSGSENEENYFRFPVEIHIVHHRTSYHNISAAKAAANDSSAIAVLGIFVQIQNKRNANFAPIVQAVMSMRGQNPSNSSVSSVIPALPLGSLVRRAYRSGFYRYQGSLTTPTCNEQVTWTVFEKPIKVSDYQIEPFRRLLSEYGTPLLTNHRPLQPIGARKIYYSP